MRRLYLLTMFALGCASAGEERQAADASVRSDASGSPVDATKGLDAANANPCAFTGVLASYGFAGETGTQAQTVAATMASGVTAGPIKRAATLTATSGAASINSTSWPTA